VIGQFVFQVILAMVATPFIATNGVLFVDRLQELCADWSPVEWGKVNDE
jgi:hypothetical protein